MAKIEIPYYLTPKLGTEMNSGHYLVSVELRDGRLFTNLVVKEGRFITGRRDDPNGEGTLLFNSMDICDIQRRACKNFCVKRGHEIIPKGIFDDRRNDHQEA